MHWETKNSCDSLYCNIRFTVVVWGQTCNSSEVFLYMSLCQPIFRNSAIQIQDDFCLFKLNVFSEDTTISPDVQLLTRS